MVMDKDSTPQWRRSLPAAVLIYAAFYFAWLFFGRELSRERFLIGNVSMFFTTLLAASTAAWVTSHISQRPILKAWRWLTTGLFIWSAADLSSLLSAYWGGTQSKITSLHDVILLVGFVPVWVGLMLYPRSRMLVHNRVHQWINITVTTTALVTLVWIIVIAPNQLLTTQLQTSKIAVYLPIADLLSLIILVILFLLSDVRNSATPLIWFSMGLVSYLFSDFTYARLVPQMAYEVGSLLDAGWVIGDLLFLFGAYAQLTQEPFVQNKALQSFLTSVQSLLPFLSIICLGIYAFFDWWLTGHFDQLGLWVVFLLSIAMIVRQAMLAGEVSIRQYASLVNSIAEATFVCDEKGVLQLVNPAFVSLIGVGNTGGAVAVQQIFGGSTPWHSVLTTAKRSGWSAELVVVQRSGKEIPVSLSLRPIHPGEDRRLVIAGTLFDLSEQKQQQHALEQANLQINQDRAQLEVLNTQLEQMVVERTRDLQEAYVKLEQQNITLQKLDQLKSDFVSMVSHELRAPLTNINGGIELLLSDQHQAPSAQYKLQLVQKEITRLTRFVETILDLSAMDAGKLPLYPMPLNIKVFINQFKETLQNQQQIQRMQWQVPEDLPPVNADDHALHSILFHLLDNALKYAPEGQIVIRVSANDDCMELQIEDEGPGIAEDVLSNLFERFYRPDARDSRTVYGYGLGLYIVKRLSEAMQGTIQVRNREPHGALFTLTLPLFQEGMDA